MDQVAGWSRFKAPASEVPSMEQTKSPQLIAILSTKSPHVPTAKIHFVIPEPVYCIGQQT